MPESHLSKSRYLSGLQCDLRLWLDAYQPSEATPTSTAQEHIFRMGTQVGEAARNLFPGGVLVRADASQHTLAFEQTRALIADEFVPALFEAAFEFDGVRVRVDILERLEGDSPRFGIREVKSSTSWKESQHLPDLAIQKWVLEHCGVSVGSAELVHLNPDYRRGESSIEWPEIFTRAEQIERLGPAEMQAVGERVDAMREKLSMTVGPVREPDAFCKRPHPCPYWDSCTAGKPARWFIEGVSTNSERKAIMLDVAESQEPWISESLAEDLESIEAPLWALDFETIGAALPLYEGTQAYQPIPFQWSLHRLSSDGTIHHLEFLANGRTDPREEVANELVRTLEQDDRPILVYSGYEKSRLKELAAAVPTLETSLMAIIDRLVDLLPIIRNKVYHPDFLGSYSIKYVAPALAPTLSYQDLGVVSDGAGAMGAFAHIASGRLSPAAEAVLRESLLQYCERDTQALLDVFLALESIIGRDKRAPG
jgi:hypothetical protein